MNKRDHYYIVIRSSLLIIVHDMIV